jgi:hypothetical protein
MSNPSRQVKKKAVYEPPQLQIIDLAAEEVLAVGCKIQSGVTARLNDRFGKNSCLAPRQCYAEGS